MSEHGFSLIRIFLFSGIFCLACAFLKQKSRFVKEERPLVCLIYEQFESNGFN